MLRIAFVGVLVCMGCGSARATPAEPDRTGSAKPARLAGTWHIAFSPKTQRLAVKVGEQYCGEVTHTSTDLVLVPSAGLEQQVLPWIACSDFDDFTSDAGPAHGPRARAVIQARAARIDHMLASGGFVPLSAAARHDLVAGRDHVRLIRNGKAIATAARRKDLDQHDRERVIVRHAALVPALGAIAVVIVPEQTPRSHYEYAEDRFEFLMLRLPR